MILWEVMLSRVSIGLGSDYMQSLLLDIKGILFFKAPFVYT